MIANRSCPLSDRVIRTKQGSKSKLARTKHAKKPTDIVIEYNSTHQDVEPDIYKV